MVYLLIKPLLLYFIINLFFGAGWRPEGWGLQGRSRGGLPCRSGCRPVEIGRKPHGVIRGVRTGGMQPTDMD